MDRARILSATCQAKNAPTANSRWHSLDLDLLSQITRCLTRTTTPMPLSIAVIRRKTLYHTCGSLPEHLPSARSSSRSSRDKPRRSVPITTGVWPCGTFRAINAAMILVRLPKTKVITIALSFDCPLVRILDTFPLSLLKK